MSALKRFWGSPLGHGSIAAALLIAAIGHWGTSSYLAYMVLLVCIYGIAALGLNVPAGMLGQLSLGQGAAFGLGAYAAAVLAMDYGHSVIVCLALATLIGGVLGVIMAAPSARLGVMALAIVSLGFTLVMQQLIILFRSITGGADGRYGLTAPLLQGQVKMSPDQLGALIVLVLLMCYCAHWYFRSSTVGRTLIAIRDNEIGAASLGIGTYAWIVFAYAIGSAIGALAGACYAFLNVSVNPDSFGTPLSVLFLLMVIAGGAGTQFGPLVGSIVVGLIPILLSAHPNIQPFLYGAFLILTVRLMPRGIIRRSAAPVYGYFRGNRSREAATGLSPAVRDATAPVLEVKGLERHFAGITAIKDISFSLAKGEVVAIIGPNGSGKTTVLNTICGIYPPHGGSVVLNGRRLDGLSLAKIASAGIGRTFQVPRLFQGLSVKETLVLAQQRAHGGFAKTNVDTIFGFLAQIGLQEQHFQREVRELPHGQLRMLEIALAALRGADILLLDECAAGLSAHEMDLMLVLLRKLAKTGTSIIIVEHHLDLVRAIADKVYVMNIGRMLWSGKPEALEESAEVRAAYLGEI